MSVASQARSPEVQSPADGAPGMNSTRWAVTLAIVCLWLLVAATVTPQQRDDAAAGMDAIAKVKIVIRLGSLACLGFALVRLAQVPNHRRVWATLWPFVLFVGWAAMSVIWSPLRTLSMGQTLSFAVLLLLTSVLAMAFDVKRDMSRLMGHLCTVLFGYSAVLLAAFFVSGRSSEGDRFGFGLVHPTAAAGAASVGLITILAAFMIWRWRWAKLLLLPSLAVYLSVIYISHNRTTLAASALAVMLIGLLYGNRTVVAGLMLASCLAGLSVVMLDPGLKSIETAIDPLIEYAARDQSASELSEGSGRAEMWTAMWKSHREAPWMGHGYFVTSKTGEMLVWYRKANFTAHNMFLQALVTTGIIGAFLLSVGLVVVTLRAVASLFRSGCSPTATYFLAITLWLLIWGFTNSGIVGPVAAFSVTYFVALGVWLGNWRAQRPTQPTHQPAPSTSRNDRLALEATT